MERLWTPALFAPLLSLVLAAGLATAQPSRHAPLDFQGRMLLALSDADTVASAYVDGKPGAIEGSDALSVIALGGDPRRWQAVTVDTSNSVAGPPVALAVTPDGRHAFVVETFTPRPAGKEEAVLCRDALLESRHEILARQSCCNLSGLGTWRDRQVALLRQGMQQRPQAETQHRRAAHVAKLVWTRPACGLLVYCAPSALDDVLAIFRRHGFDQAAVVGDIAATSATPRLAVR